MSVDDRANSRRRISAELTGMAERHLLYSLRVDHSIVVYCRCGWCGVYDSDGTLHHDMRGRYEDHARIALHAITRLRESEHEEREP
jgi:hypothetical protein